MDNNNYTTLCIPRISSSTPKDIIYKAFCSLKVGYILRLTEAPIKKDNGYKRIIITLRWNKDTYNTQRMRNIIDQGKSVKIVYDDPWYWKVLPFKK
jgi:hypothetical protein